MFKRLILFDIDGTLIASNFAGRQVMSHALREVYGTDGALDSTSFAGKTDLGIITAALTQAGLDKSLIDAGLPRVYEEMAANGATRFFQDNLVPCPGVMLLLNELRANQHVVLGLQTGNVRATAHQKLIAAGFDPAWFPVTAFGSDSAGREGLLPAAWRRANELTGDLFSGHNTIVVGDTPGDITSARSNGARALAVATGVCTFITLTEYQPDYLLPDLSDTEHVMKILTGQGAD